MNKMDLEKISLTLSSDEWHGHSSETVWADKLDRGKYRIRSVPFYAKGFSFGDVVFTKSEAGKETVCGVLLRSGHSTYRVFVKPPTQIGSRDFDHAWQRLQNLGCTYERATEHLIAVDVPSAADINAVYVLLDAGEKAGIWEFEEGHCGSI